MGPARSPFPFRVGEFFSTLLVKGRVLVTDGQREYTFGPPPCLHAGEKIYRFDRPAVVPSAINWRVDLAETKARLAGRGTDDSGASQDDEWPDRIGGFA
jgi:hypothetical protein